MWHVMDIYHVADIWHVRDMYHMWHIRDMYHAADICALCIVRSVSMFVRIGGTADEAFIL